MKLPVSVIVITCNEGKNIAGCLDSVADWAGEIIVVDSGSADRTREIARLYTDKVYEHPFENYAKQRNWAQENIPIKNDWLFHLDADERISPALSSSIHRIFSSGIEADGFFMPRKTIFRGKWIGHGGHYPTYHMRLFKKDKGKSEERYYDQHYIVNGRTAMITGDIINTVTSDIKALIGRYKVELEAREILSNRMRVMNLGLKNGPIGRINWLRYNVYYKMPLFIRPALYFLYRYFLRLGFLDGAPGLVFHFYQGFVFRFLIDLEILRSMVKRILFPGLDLHTRCRYKFMPKYFRAGPVRTLDVGCGNGALSYAAYRIGNFVLGITDDPRQTDKAGALLAFRCAEPDRIQFKTMNIYDLPGLDQKFDQIICSETLEHIKRDREAAGYFYKLLNPGGILHLSAPYALHPEHNIGRKDAPEDGGHVRDGYTPDTYRSLLESAGFKIVETAGFGSRLLVGIDKVIRKIRNGRGGDAMALPLFLLTFPLQELDRQNPAVPFSIYVKAVKC